MKVAKSQQTNEILRCYATGMAVSKIADRFDCTAHNVYQIVKYHGVLRGSVVDDAKPEPQPEIRAQVSEVKRLAAKGLTITRIGALLRCPYREIAKALET